MVAARSRLDTIDQRLAEALVQAPRATVRDLASTVGLSHSATRARVHDLIATRVVEVVTLVHPAARGQSMIFYATITLRGDPPADLDRIAVLDDASWIWRYRHTPQLQAQMSAPGTDGVHAVVDQITALPWVERVSLMIVLKVHAARDGTARSGPGTRRWDHPRTTSLDPVDRAITRYLRSNGRASYTELAHAVGLSLTAVRRRVLALQAADVIRFVTFINIPGALHAVLYLDVPTHRTRFLAAATAADGIVAVMELVGPHDVGCIIVVPHQEALAATVADLVALPGVTTHELHPFTILRRTLTRRTGRDGATGSTP